VISSGDILMAIGMGLIKDRNGTWMVRRKVSPHLREPVSRVLNASKQQQTWLQRSTRTKHKDEAKRLAPAIMAEFAETLAKAEGLLAERPLRTTLTDAEISRLADWHYAIVLSTDEAFTTEDAVEDEELFRSIAKQLTEAGITMPIPLDPHGPPTYGLSNRQLIKRADHLADWLPLMRGALARGDISMVSEAMTELLDRAQLNLDPNCASYRKLGLAVLRADVRAWEAVARRANGEPIETPAIAAEEPLALEGTKGTPAARGSKGAPTLRAAFEGWKKEGTRASTTAVGYEHALDLWEQLHGDIPVADIRKAHALRFREALQEVPSGRSKAIKGLSLPQLVEWKQSHPDVPALTVASVNKLMAGVQALAKWAHRNGLVPDDRPWADPFSQMKLAPSGEEGGGPFEPHELRRLFSSPIFTAGERPVAGQGETAFWLPLLALFTGCRRSELTKRKATDITEVDGTQCLLVYSDKAAGQPLKTVGSARTIPIHPELERLGLLEFVKAQGDDWLFQAVATDKAANTWGQWFRRYLDRLELGGGGRGLHSLRHNFIDALRAAGVTEDLNDALTGHSNHSVGRSYGARARHSSQRHKVIVNRYGMPRLVEAVGKVQYPSVELGGVRSAWARGGPALHRRSPKRPKGP
jgi:integrase